ncbi:CDP-alcohol phosphatidyltransferase family protein [Rhabdothermincola salaria]|uniref:CDP-alcohol phosphatidyltransferase family protein n=1 Tax=Rhabdothermincola salaria TaxID=2903142 RepID=UPI001E4B1D5E|nr:CDP-alcohol phosphatidyltransferase family protein [Rhabdothermincola salaria]MCD9623106.1 CDP-alcohol phosphatidyltransferase family protein [Rhabdothermincola salaria]
MPASPPPDPVRRGARPVSAQAASEKHAIEVHRDDVAGEDRIVTVPNVITFVRLALLPVFVWLLLGQGDQGAAAWLLAGLGATDWVDGYIARRWHQVSTLGKVLDPVADRLLFFVAIVAIIIDGAAPLWLCVAVLVREGLVAGATLTLAALGAVRIDVTWFGKAGTFALMFAFPLFLAGASTMWWADEAAVMAWAFAVPGLVLSYYAAVMYVPAGIRALREGRAARAG